MHSSLFSSRAGDFSRFAGALEKSLKCWSPIKMRETSQQWIVIEGLQVKKNNHYEEFEMLSCGCVVSLYWQLLHKASITINTN